VRLDAACHTAQCVGPIRSRIGTALATTPLFNLGKAKPPPLLATGCHEQTSGSLLAAPQLAYWLVQRGQEETSGRLWYLWARHPAITGGDVHHVHAVSCRPARLLRLAARPHGTPLLLRVLLQRQKRKGPLPTGKGPLTCGTGSGGGI
jgi:hypothetical protein